MDRPLTLDTEEGVCQWCYRQRTVVIAIGSALGLCLGFVGAVFMAHFADHTPGWSLLIAATCVVFGLLAFLVIVNIIRCACPQCVRDDDGGGSGEKNTTAKTGTRPENVIMDEDSRVSLYLHDGATADDFEL